MMNTDKPEDLEAQATALEADARAMMLIHHASEHAHERACAESDQKLSAAHRLRERAAALRHRRTDGVRFG